MPTSPTAPFLTPSTLTTLVFAALLLAGLALRLWLASRQIRHVARHRHAVPAAFADRITLIPGDAAEVLKTLDGPYDFIFMDAAKGQYIHFLPEVLRVLDKNGVLITDNVLQDGDVIESRFAVERRNRTIHKRMREYLFELTHNEGLLTSVVPLGDGIAITMKSHEKREETT